MNYSDEKLHEALKWYEKVDFNWSLNGQLYYNTSNFEKLKRILSRPNFIISFSEFYESYLMRKENYYNHKLKELLK